MNRLTSVPTRAARAYLAAVCGVVLGFMLASPSPVSAQGVREEVPTRSYELWLGAAGGSPDLGILGITPGQQFGLVSFRVRSLMHDGPRAAFYHTVDWIPLAVTSKPVVYPHDGSACQDALCPEPGVLFGEGAAYGFGLTPLGGEVVFTPSSGTELSFGAAGGALLFDRPVPITSAMRFNFTASVSAALSLVSPRGSGWTLGYRFHHLSNAGLVDNNPGLASHVVFVGARWQRSTSAAGKRTDHLQVSGVSGRRSGSRRAVIRAP